MSEHMSLAPLSRRLGSPDAVRGRKRQRTLLGSLEWLEDRVVPAAAFSAFVDPHASIGDGFGAQIVPLSTGNVVITAPDDNAGGPDAGAVYLFNGTTGALISTLTGSHEHDQIGFSLTGTRAGVIPLSNGNFLIYSSGWWANRGAVTFENGTTGLSGQVDATNSLVGSQYDDYIGSQGVILLANGNYVVDSPLWSSGSIPQAGAVTFGNGTAGVSGEISAANSLVGSSPYDNVGAAIDPRTSDLLNGVTALKNGNYVVTSGKWSDQKGAVTFGNGATGVTGTVGQNNSLIDTGSSSGGVTELATGNFVVVSLSDDTASDGAVIFENGTTGLTGVMSAANSLIGSGFGDSANFTPPPVSPGVMQTTFASSTTKPITALSNGNYLVTMPNWSGGYGAVTFGSGTSGVAGMVGSANSLVGQRAGDSAGFGGVTILPNDNYLVWSPLWSNGGTDGAGAVTFGNGTDGTVGEISPSNSLVGSTTNDYVGGELTFTALPFTFGSGQTVYEASYSFSPDITVLNNGDYVVRSPDWTNGGASAAGAVTFGNGATGVSGDVNTTNSLVGSQADDKVGSGGITALGNGNYLVVSPLWANGSSTTAGAVTFANATAAPTGTIDATNSLIGSAKGDGIGSGGITPLTNGNYVVDSPSWANQTGAVTFGTAASGVVGVVSSADSLVGDAPGDSVGGGVTALTNGNYVVASPDWANGSASSAGAVTFGNGTTGVIGVVNSMNSLVGSTTGDHVGSGVPGSTALSNGNYVVSSPSWSNGSASSAGAATFGNGTTGVAGVVSSGNSLVGENTGDQVGKTITALGNGNYVVGSPMWANGGAAAAGASTFGNGVAGVSGLVSPSNSLVGSQSGDQVGSRVNEISSGNYVIVSLNWANGSTANAGAATFANGTSGVSGVLSASNSLVGTAEQPFDEGGGSVVSLVTGNFLVIPSIPSVTPTWVAFGNGTTGVVGTISRANSAIDVTRTYVINNALNSFYTPVANQVLVGSLTTGFPPTFSFPPIPALDGIPQFAAGSGTGGTGTVTVYNPDQSVAYTATPFGSSFTAGVRVAVADLTGAGTPDLIAATGPGVANQVVVVDGTTHQVVATFSPFESTFTGGLYVTAGDLNGDGIPDIIVTPDQGGGPVVAVYDGAALAKGIVTQVVRFFGINDPSFRGGARAAVGDVNGDGTPDLIVSAGDGGGPRVAIYNGATVPSGTPTELMPDFFAFESSLRNGVYVTAGDVTGSGYTDLVFGAGPGGGPRVRVVNPQVLLSVAGNFSSLDDSAVAGAEVADFFAGDPSGRDGVPVAVKDLDGTDQAGLVAGSGSSGTVTGYTGAAMLSNPSSPATDFSLDALPGFTGGVFVG
ncbi:beta strand repeat-containing protein [Fimbriiglobus ruber]|uniref:Filamentous hemagglutinin-like protein n=1 Tax=Fimbriiglobus ruber TaxID=1908690 RepID=A0A225EGZ5_9BACT|nr:FG-GAP-like repeat-containing protein [Fimbriiglobus ruber]OWK47467.1 Filamentous hemagglutinin-like protein [Fimbriiglobus ruber]